MCSPGGLPDRADEGLRDALWFPQAKDLRADVPPEDDGRGTVSGLGTINRTPGLNLVPRNTIDQEVIDLGLTVAVRRDACGLTWVQHVPQGILPPSGARTAGSMFQSPPTTTRTSPLEAIHSDTSW